ncbi:hypothetical protein CAPTEDRAFT_224650 [Capitella teleta]|uniref:Pseudouridine synthase RsuA/RluA-like domain-containing protein n=1 Tax=Capitella teleta TaxID=283909 RepID=R7UFN6_CAPTE|nr:hypothetical protein CAPTEDRAFT_224650 [Capitella teleta]|eukprot:ELU02087.1 hypothetical protein CAPTEDRAFT_224650 [Capitella teleta]
MAHASTTARRHGKVMRISAWIQWKHSDLQALLKGNYCKPNINDIQVLYQSSNFIVVNKHYDLVINSDDPSVLSVETQLRHLHPELVDSSIAHGFRFAHRLDYSTSGVLCLGLNRKAAGWAMNAFRNRRAVKYYTALLRGHVSPTQAKNQSRKLEGDIGMDVAALERGAHHMCLASEPNCKDAKSATTELVLLQHGQYEGRPVSKVLLIPHTGRTHQLRVHCAALGHHIVGDYTYSRRTDTNTFRMMLHAHRLCLPLSKEDLDVTAPDPFQPEFDARWKPEQSFMTVQEWEHCEATEPETVQLCKGSLE